MARIISGSMLAITVSVTGCGGTDHPPLYPVTGKVEFADGQPLAVGGSVRFQSIATQGNDRTLDAVGVINSDGVFELSTRDFGRGVAAGDYRALVHGARDLKKNPTWPPPSIHPRFGRFETAGLNFVVEEGDNDFTIVVEPPPAKVRNMPPGRSP